MRPLYGSLAAGLIKTVKLKYKIFLFTIPILLLLKRGFGGRKLHLSLREKNTFVFVITPLCGTTHLLKLGTGIYPASCTKKVQENTKKY